MKLYDELRLVTNLWIIRMRVTDRRLAADLGVSVSALRDFCGGKTVLRAEPLEKLIAVLRAAKMLPDSLRPGKKQDTKLDAALSEKRRVGRPRLKNLPL